ncbi:hypothetical protein Droror1_Dr00023259 [Drosera rotundifolia]
MGCLCMLFFTVDFCLAHLHRCSLLISPPTSHFPISIRKPFHRLLPISSFHHCSSSHLPVSHLPISPHTHFPTSQLNFMAAAKRIDFDLDRNDAVDSMGSVDGSGSVTERAFSDVAKIDKARKHGTSNPSSRLSYTGCYFLRWSMVHGRLSCH